MNSARFPIAGLMAVVAAIAINLTVLRSFNESQPDFLGHLFFACGVMPMASVLFLIALFSTPSLLRGNRFSSFALGFEAFGWLAVFAFVTVYSVAPSALLASTEWIGARTRPVLEPLFQGAPGWIQLSVELGCGAIIFSLPELVIALFGGWLARKAGITLRFERWRRGETGRLCGRNAERLRRHQSVATQMAIIALIERHWRRHSGRAATPRKHARRAIDLH